MNPRLPETVVAKAAVFDVHDFAVAAAAALWVVVVPSSSTPLPARGGPLSSHSRRRLNVTFICVCVMYARDFNKCDKKTRHTSTEDGGISLIAPGSF